MRDKATGPGAEPFAPSRRALLGGGAIAGIAAVASAGPAAAQSCKIDENQARLLDDFGGLARYAEENAALLASGARVDIVFMGDSITEGWKAASSAFWTPGRINRGISGQTTPQMLLRFMQDVIALRPRAVHVMAGTNDIAGNTGPMTLRQTTDNLAAMATLARASGIAVLLASTPPALAFGWRPDIRPADRIRELNAWIRRHAAEIEAPYVDYHAALATPRGGMRAGMADDGVHPTPRGYAVMERVATPFLAQFEARGDPA